MIVYQASLQMALNALVGPDAGTNGGFASGGLSLGLSVTEQYAAATKVIAARMTFGASGATSQVDFEPAGAIGFVRASEGVKQVESLTVTAAAGCTTAGNLVVTLTGAPFSGSPVAINVALTPAAHSTAALIASAIAAALNAHVASGFPSYYVAEAAGAFINLRALYPMANDGTLNLAIAAGLGVSAVTTSTNATAGVAGSIIDMPALANYDAVASEYANFSNVDALVLRVLGPNSVSGVADGGAVALPPVKTGKAFIWQADAFEPKFSLQATGISVADLLIVGH